MFNNVFAGNRVKGGTNSRALWCQNCRLFLHLLSQQRMLEKCSHKVSDTTVKTLTTRFKTELIVENNVLGQLQLLIIDNY